jgi:hypothetical protein
LCYIGNIITTNTNVQVYNNTNVISTRVTFHIVTDVHEFEL